MTMKTDYEKSKELFDGFGIEYESGMFEQKLINNQVYDGYFIYCKYGGKKVGGYIAFYTQFTFDKNGKFVEIGAYE